jgi:hypothetical protein
MSSTTRFPNGVTNVSEVSMFADLKQLDPTQYHTYWEDFDYYGAAADWSGNPADAALTNADGGVIEVSKTSGAGVGYIQKIGQSFTVEVGKRLWLQAKVKLNDNAQGLFVGLGTVPPSSDDFWFVYDPVNGLQFVIGTTITPLNLTLASDTYVVLGVYVNESGVVSVFVNGQFVKTATGTLSASTVSPIMVAYAINNPAVLSIDYFLAVKER